MKQTLEGVLKYLRKNYCSYWIILGIHIPYLSQYHTFFTIKGFMASDGECVFKDDLYGYCYLDFHTSNRPGQ